MEALNEVKDELWFSDLMTSAVDAVRIGEGTSAVLRGKQAAFEVAQNLGVRYNYDEHLKISFCHAGSAIRNHRRL